MMYKIYFISIFDNVLIIYCNSRYLINKCIDKAEEGYISKNL